ncbi:MAG: RAMP superfamily CRISPR-associated protein [Synechococcales bacterium]|nr:RAMP superfamily CRISPR-associated protein [Synechococcales bacterium]
MNRNQPSSPKPYDFVSFPQTKPILVAPIGHDRYHGDRFHGALYLTLTVQTALHISTGITALGSDVGSRLPLIKTMTTTDNQLVLQGSSLKGCLRSVYEAITNSTLAVITSRYKNTIPPERLPCRDKGKLCPASRVFGAMDWQGLVEFQDAKYKGRDLSTGFMPSLYSPHPDSSNYKQRGQAAGRKFYYNMTRVINQGENRGIPVQQANQQYTFETVIHYKNLLPEELGIVLLILGQDQKSPIALKVGGGKPIGMGTMTTTIRAIEQSQDITDRYRNYKIDQAKLTDTAMQKFIQIQISAAHRSKLLEKEQWQQLSRILKYPGDHEPPEGMY